MKRIEATDDRKQAIGKFDSCMERFFDSSAIFQSELIKIPSCDEDNVKMYSLAMNYYHDTILVIDIATSYYPYIAYSMLSVNHEKHDALYKRFESEFIILKHRLSNILDSYSIEIGDYFPNEISLDEQLAIMDKSITGQFDENGIIYFREILKNLQKIEDALKSLQVVGAERTASSYEEIYDRMKEEYYNSDIWDKLKGKFISKLIERKFKDTPITVEAIGELIEELQSDLSGHDDIGSIWEAYGDNKTELSKAIVRKEFESSTAIEQMFEFLGKIELLEEWSEEIKFEELPYEEAEETMGLVQGVEFVSEREEQRFKDSWDDIYAYMENEIDAEYAWCCLHHTLTFYNIIKKTTFKFFMKWLHLFAGKELISDTNIRKVSSYYFVDVVETQWSLQDMKRYYEQEGKQKVTTQLENKFRKYSDICDQLREIIRYH